MNIVQHYAFYALLRSGVNSSHLSSHLPSCIRTTNGRVHSGKKIRRQGCPTRNDALSPDVNVPSDNNFHRHNFAIVSCLFVISNGDHSKRGDTPNAAKRYVPAKEGSKNYAIGEDARIGLYHPLADKRRTSLFSGKSAKESIYGRQFRCVSRYVPLQIRLFVMV